MKKILIYSLILSIIPFTFSCNTFKNSFVRTQNTQFVVGNKPYYFVGTNYWYGITLGMAGEKGDRERLNRELDQMQKMGITNLRILASSEGAADAPWRVQPAVQTAAGVYDEQVLEGLDYLLVQMRKRGMKGVMVLNNFWAWSGGMVQYLEWSGKGPVPYPFDGSHSWNEYISYAKQFYTDKGAMQQFEAFLAMLINRTNSINGKAYKEDPTIMAWQLANEPRGYDQREAYLKWVDHTASYIKSLDSKHLVCIGTEGNTPGKDAGTDVYSDNLSNQIDYVTMHIWIQNWSWFDPTKAETTYPEALVKVDDYFKKHIEAGQQLNKPVVLEEFGISRDHNDHKPSATIEWRDKYYGYLFNKSWDAIKGNSPLTGINFWSYAGEGRPNNPEGFWQKGDDLIGDPPHEPQGWYSVYDQDTTTIDIISGYAEKINDFSKQAELLQKKAVKQQEQTSR
ncbi:hypothetical protein V6R21_04000 [Limibacter armeniacum]|uniref:glycoside hydrolase 5 family protein n=1 Tax=Limibacter armeniacum TaxID=466084 RepID=UPI002FE5D654